MGDSEGIGVTADLDGGAMVMRGDWTKLNELIAHQKYHHQYPKTTDN